MLPDPAAAPAHFANRLLVDQRWARDKLAPFAGRTFSLKVGPVHAGWRINDGGLLDPLPGAPAVDVALSVSPWSVPSFLANPSRWNEFVHEDGDPLLGGALKALAQTIPWFVEATFAERLGPIAGQRVADAGRRLLAFPEYATQRVTESLVSYGRDEAQLLARGDDMRRFTAQVDATADAVDGLALRIDALAGRAAARAAGIR